MHLSKIKDKTDGSSGRFKNSAKKKDHSEELVDIHATIVEGRHRTKHSHPSTSYSSTNSNMNKENSNGYIHRTVPDGTHVSKYHSSEVDFPQENLSFSNRTPESFDLMDYSPKFYSPNHRTGSFHRTPSPQEKRMEFNISEFKTAIGIPQKKRTLLSIDIDVGKGKSAHLQYFENENPNEVAKRFCMQHNLPENAAPIVELNIHKNLQKLAKTGNISENHKKDTMPPVEVINEDPRESLRSTSREMPALLVALEIEGKFYEVKVFENQDSMIIAKSFCEKHNLAPDAQHYLAKNIQFYIDRYRIKASKHNLQNHDNIHYKRDSNFAEKQTVSNGLNGSYVHQNSARESPGITNKMHDRSELDELDLSVKFAADDKYPPEQQDDLLNKTRHIPKQHLFDEASSHPVNTNYNKRNTEIESLKKPQEHYEKWQKLISQKNAQNFFPKTQNQSSNKGTQLLYLIFLICV